MYEVQVSHPTKQGAEVAKWLVVLPLSATSGRGATTSSRPQRGSGEGADPPKVLDTGLRMIALVETVPPAEGDTSSAAWNESMQHTLENVVRRIKGCLASLPVKSAASLMRAGAEAEVAAGPKPTLRVLLNLDITTAEARRAGAKSRRVGGDTFSLGRRRGRVLGFVLLRSDPQVDQAPGEAGGSVWCYATASEAERGLGVLTEDPAGRGALDGEDASLWAERAVVRAGANRAMRLRALVHRVLQGRTEAPVEAEPQRGTHARSGSGVVVEKSVDGETEGRSTAGGGGAEDASGVVVGQVEAHVVVTDDEVLCGVRSGAWVLGVAYDPDFTSQLQALSDSQQFIRGVLDGRLDGVLVGWRS